MEESRYPPPRSKFPNLIHRYSLSDFLQPLTHHPRKIPFQPPYQIPIRANSKRKLRNTATPPCTISLTTTFQHDHRAHSPKRQSSLHKTIPHTTYPYVILTSYSLMFSARTGIGHWGIEMIQGLGCWVNGGIERCLLFMLVYWIYIRTLNGARGRGLKMRRLC